MPNHMYTLDELLEDNRFIAFSHHPSEEDEQYWMELIEQGKLKQEDFELGCYYIRTLINSNDSLTHTELSDMLDNILIENKKAKKPKNRSFYMVAAIAASIALLTGMYYFFTIPEEEIDTLAGNTFDISRLEKPDYNHTDIQVVLSENKTVSIKENNTAISYNDKGEATINSQTIDQSVDSPDSNAYNQVIVPKGKHSSLLLSDGSKLYLNAASRVIYPPVFDKDKREIYLEGEAYLEVEHDGKRPFIVQTNQMRVKVLGTSFNISAYEDEVSQTVVLVNGSVSVQTNQAEANETLLKPNELLSLTGNQMVIRTVDTGKYVSWRHGFYQYDRERLALIFKKISDYYGIIIEFEPEVGEMRYAGKLDLKEDVERVLNGLTFTAPIQYEKKNGIYYLRLNQP